MKKVLFIVNYQNKNGGIRVQVDNLTMNMEKDGVVATEIFNTKGTFLQRLLFPFKLFLAAKYFDNFHIHGCSRWGGFYPIIIGVIVGKILRKKIIITYHGGDAEIFFNKYPSITHFFLSKADLITVPSAYLNEIFPKFGLFPVIIPNILVLRKDIYKKRDRISPKFISIRNLEPVYNVELILQAFTKIKETFPEASLTVLGDGSERKKLESLVSEKNLKNVSFLGSISNNEVYGQMAKNDIFLNASTIDNMPLSIIEAFNAGLLVISSNAGGIPFLVKNLETGLLFEKNNLDDFVSKIEFALNQSDKSLEITHKARNACIVFQWSSNRTLYESIYK